MRFNDAKIDLDYPKPPKLIITMSGNGDYSLLFGVLKDILKTLGFSYKSNYSSSAGQNYIFQLKYWGFRGKKKKDEKAVLDKMIARVENANTTN